MKDQTFFACIMCMHNDDMRCGHMQNASGVLEETWGSEIIQFNLRTAMSSEKLIKAA